MESRIPCVVQIIRIPATTNSKTFPERARSCGSVLKRVQRQSTPTARSKSLGSLRLACNTMGQNAYCLSGELGFAASNCLVSTGGNRCAGWRHCSSARERARPIEGSGPAPGPEHKTRSSHLRDQREGPSNRQNSSPQPAADLED